MVKQRRKAARLLLPFVVAGLTVASYREARAFAPAAGPLAISFVDSVAATVAAIVEGQSTASLFGLGAVYAMVLSLPGDSTNAPSSVRVPLTVSTPATAFPLNAPAVGNPPGTRYSCNYTVTGVATCTWQESPDWACDQFISISNRVSRLNGTGTVYAKISATSTVCTYSMAGAGSYTQAMTVQANSCTSGYTLSNGQCNLTDAKAVPLNVQDVTRSANAFGWNTQQTPGQLQAYKSASDTVQVSGQTSAGKPLLVTVQATTDSGAKVTISTQVEDANGSTYLRNQTLTVSAGGVVTSAAQTATAQVLSENTGTGGYTSASGPASTFSPATSSTGTGSTEFPSDYARVGEAASAAATVTAAVNNMSTTLHHDLTDTAQAPTDPTVPGSADFENAFFKNTFSNLLGWTLPSHSSQCPTATIDVSGVFGSGRIYQLNSHCQLITDHFGIFSTSMTVVWTVLALFIVLAA